MVHTDGLQPLPQRTNWLLLALTALCTAGVLVLAARVHHLGGPLRADTRADSAVAVHIWGIPIVPLRFARVYEVLGSTPCFALLAAAAVAAAARLRDTVMVLVAVAGPPVALLLAEKVGKPLVARAEFRSYSFPSGHTTAMAALATVVALLVYRRWGVRTLVLAMPALALIPVVMVLVVIRIRSHFLTDALAGVLLGSGTVLAVAIAVSTAARMAVGSRRGREASSS